MRSLAFLTMLAAAALAEGLPPDWVVEGKSERANGALTALGPATIAVPVEAGRVVTVSLRLGATGAPLAVRASGPDKRALVLTLTAKDLPKAPWRTKETVKDAGFDVLLREAGKPPLLRDHYWARPNPHFYHKDDLKRALADWDKLPSASQWPLSLRVDVGDAAVAVWLDDRFIGRAPFRPDKVTLSLRPGAAVLAGSAGPLADDARYVPLRLAGYRRAGSAGATAVSVPAGRRAVGGVPFEVAAPAESIDVGISRWLEESKGPDDFTDDYYTRSAFDGTPESILLAVPAGDYSHVHLLCAVDPDAAKTPALTLRMTRFLEDMLDSGGRGEGIADTEVRLDRPNAGRAVGEVVLDTAGGKRRVPLLHVRARLDSGHIQDVLDEEGLFYRRSTQSLDLELTRELHQVTKSNHANYSTKPLGKPSGVRVFGLTLERSPVRVRLGSPRVGNVFYADEHPELVVTLTDLSGARFEGELACDITDFYGARRTVRQQVVVESGRTESVALDVRQPKLGWFDAAIRLRSKAEIIWEVPTRFAILPPDTRKAGGESPLGVWWFRRSHVGTDSVDAVAPLLKRAGIRHVCPGGRGPTGAELAKHGITVSMFPNVTRPRRSAKAEETLDKWVKEHPDVKWALIFHESGFREKLVFPPEFIREAPPKLTEEQEARFKDLWDRAIAASKLYRRKHPDIRLIFGNSSLPFAVEFMRRGYPREYIDALGDEDLGQLIMPEAPPQAYKSIYWLQEYAKLYKYDVPITSCYEWRCRPTTPGNLTEREQAELYARDCLHGLAFRMPHINVGLLHDVGDAYYYSRWGGTGICRRYPLLAPKISYVALATLTRELDGATFVRCLPSGSPSLYICEFQRADGFVYALWLPRGERQVALTFEKPTPYTLTDMVGNARGGASAGKATVQVSSSPSYLRCSARIAKAEAGPTTCEPPPEKRKVVADLCDLGRWRVVKEADEFLEKTHFDFPRRPGKFDLRIVDDAEKGRALEVKLLPQPDVPWPCPRYLVLEAVDAKPVAGEPTAVGMWVKGNSSWGRVMWEIEDAKGERFFSIGAPCGGWLVGDWKSRSYINFDGWNYLGVRLLTWYASGFYGPERRNWKYDGDGRVDYPIKFRRLVVELRDRVVHLTDAIPVPSRAIRLRDLGVGYE